MFIIQAQVRGLFTEHGLFFSGNTKMKWHLTLQQQSTSNNPSQSSGTLTVPSPIHGKMSKVPVMCLYCAGKTGAVTCGVQCRARWRRHHYVTYMLSNPQGVKVFLALLLWYTLNLGGGDFDVLVWTERSAVSCFWHFNQLLCLSIICEFLSGTLEAAWICASV